MKSLRRSVVSLYRILIIGTSLYLAASCGFQKQADVKFGDQNFKTSIALIEMHKIRFGAYPESISGLKFLGDWDPIYLNGIEYHRLDDGYELNISRGWVGKPELQYPKEFWNGLGLKRSNVKANSE